jgi:hypothetical protein
MHPMLLHELCLKRSEYFVNRHGVMYGMLIRGIDKAYLVDLFLPIQSFQAQIRFEPGTMHFTCFFGIHTFSFSSV